jgi:transposase-like protein
MPRRRKEEAAASSPAPDWLDQIVDQLYARIQEGEKPGLSMLLESLLNKVMERERDRHLGLYPQAQANGFYERQLSLTMGKLDLKVPRVRAGQEFRPAILPARWRRVDKDYEELLVAMLANGYSQSQIERSLHQLNLPFSAPALDDAKGLIREKLDVYKTQPLASDWFAIFIDAYHAKMRTENGQVHDIVLFSALGISLDGQKEVLGYWTHRGHENKGFWTDVLKELVARGVSRVMLFVTDDFGGLTEVIHKLFPAAEHQLCTVHLLRNLHHHLSKEAYRKVKEQFRRMQVADDKNEGMAYFNQICELVAAEKPKLAQILRSKADQYLTFLNYPREVRTYIYTTNAVESFNAGIERMRIDLGGYFPSQESLDTNLFIQVVNLQDWWWAHPLPHIRKASYMLRQLFTLRYELAPEPLHALHNF